MPETAHEMTAATIATETKEETIALDPDVARAVQQRQKRLSLRRQIYTLRALVNGLLRQQAEKRRKVV